MHIHKIKTADLGFNFQHPSALPWEHISSDESIFRLALSGMSFMKKKKKSSKSYVFQKSVWDNFLKYFNKEQQSMMKSWGKLMWNLIVLLWGCHELSLPPGHIQNQLKPIKALWGMGREGGREGSGLACLCQGSSVSSSSLSFPIVSDFTGAVYWEMIPPS